MMGLVQGLLFPTENTCHLCERALSGVPGRVLCSACEAALLAQRIPQGDIHSPHPPLYACVSAFYHSGEARLLVHRLKYQSDKRAAEPLCAAMAHAFVLAGLTAQADVAVPVPLNVLRLYERGYNQAERLADGVCGHVGVPVRPDLLSRNGTEKRRWGALGSSGYPPCKMRSVHARRTACAYCWLTMCSPRARRQLPAQGRCCKQALFP